MMMMMMMMMMTITAARAMFLQEAEEKNPDLLKFPDQLASLKEAVE